MANFKIVTTGPGNTDHSLEMESLSALGAEIVEVGGTEDDLLKAVADADAIYAKGRPRVSAKVIEAGREFFDLQNPNMKIYTEDARPWLEATGERYDVIMVDAYHQPYIPFYMATREFFELVRDRLRPGGLVLINVGHPEGSDALEQNLTATLREALPFALRDPVTETNTMLAGSAGPISAANLRLATGGWNPPVPRQLHELAAATADRIEPPLTGGEIWTDDHAPVEWLVDLSLLDYANG